MTRAGGPVVCSMPSAWPAHGELAAEPRNCAALLLGLFANRQDVPRVWLPAALVLRPWARAASQRSAAA